jgi:hypothetical protein
MEQATNQQWYLRKQDGTLFGPLTFEQLESWASNARIAPHDIISTDQINWIKAPMLPELGMDWLVEVTSERYYGPTTLGAVQEFIQLREVDGETFIINACDGTRRQIRDLPNLQLPGDPEAEAVEPPEAAETPAEPAAGRISIDLQDRIRDLEQSLGEERRALEESEDRYRELQRRYDELEQKLTSLGPSE